MHLKGLIQLAHKYSTQTDALCEFRSRLETHPQEREELKSCKRAVFTLADELTQAVRRVDAGAPLWWATWIGESCPCVAGQESAIPPWLDGPWNIFEMDAGNREWSPSTFFVGPKNGRMIACLVSEAGDSFVKRIAQHIDKIKPNRRAYLLQRIAAMNINTPVFSADWVKSTSQKERDRVIKMNQLRKLIDIPSWRNGPLLVRMKNQLLS